MKFSNSNYSISLNDKTGAIESLVSSGKEFIGTVLPLFAFQLRKKAATLAFTSDSAGKIRLSSNGDSFEGIYESFPGCDISVKVTAEFTDRIEWRISYENESIYAAEWFDYPQIAVPNDLVRTGKGTGKLLLDINEGVIIDDIDLQEYHDIVYPSRGLNHMFPAVVQSQFLSYYDEKIGLYLAVEDSSRSIKGIDFRKAGTDSIKLQFRLYPGEFPDAKLHSIPYPMVLRFFKGDWCDAAEIYRSWFESNLPEGLKRICDTADLPEWYADSPLIVTYPVRGIHDMDTPTPNRLFPYENALPHLDRIAKETSSRVMALLMHWEGTAPWSPPYVFPPLGGEALLKNFADRLHERGFVLGVYCSGLGYTLHSNLCGYSMEETYKNENLSRFMCAPPDDGEPKSTICQSIRESRDMCVSQDFAKRVVKDEVTKMVSDGSIDYIQVLDQNHGGTPYFCFGSKHGHPPVPGVWMVDNMKDLLSQLADCTGSSVLLGCESAAAEAYLPYLKLSDNRFNLNYSCGTPIPLYSYIYHEYVHNFSGNSVCSMDIIDVVRSPECHLMRIAFSFLAGDLMTVVINQDGEIAWSWGERDFSVLPNRDSIMTFIRNATAVRANAGKRYLNEGRMIKPLPVYCEQIQMVLKKHPERENRYPSVLTSAYRIPDGSAAQFLANYTGKPEEVEIDLSGISGAEIISAPDGISKPLSPCRQKITVPAYGVTQIVMHSRKMSK